MARAARRFILHIGLLVVMSLSACITDTPVTDSAEMVPDQAATPTIAPTSPPTADSPQPTQPPAEIMPTGHIAFEMHFDVGLTELLIVDLDCDPDTRICQRSPVPLLCPPMNGSSPAWSPDGTQLAFSSTQDGDSDIVLAPFDSIDSLPICPPDLIRLTDNTSEDITPAWSPDGSRIAFASNRGGSFNLYVIDADGTKLSALTNDSDFHAAPTWSPDGSRLAFETRFANNRSSIFVIDADGQNQTLLSDPGQNASDPAWSPDGSRIAFVSDRGGSPDIFLMDPDGGNVIPVTRSPRYDAAPAWSPDGQFLAFTSQRRDSLDIYIVPLACLDVSTPCDDSLFLLWDNVLIEAAPAWQPTP